MTTKYYDTVCDCLIDAQMSKERYLKDLYLVKDSPYNSTNDRITINKSIVETKKKLRDLIEALEYLTDKGKL